MNKIIKADFQYHCERCIELPLTLDYAERKYKEGCRRICDIGGAESMYLGNLLDMGYEVTVLDPLLWHDNQYYRNHLGNPNFKALQGSIHEIKVTKEDYDCALLISVLEHIGNGSYRGPKFARPEVVTFRNIEVPFAFSTPCGKEEVYGPHNERNYSQSELHDYLDTAKKQILDERYYIAPYWYEVYYEDTAMYSYGEKTGHGASAVAYFEIL